MLLTVLHTVIYKHIYIVTTGVELICQLYTPISVHRSLRNAIRDTLALLQVRSIFHTKMRNALHHTSQKNDTVISKNNLHSVTVQVPVLPRGVQTNLFAYERVCVCLVPGSETHLPASQKAYKHSPRLIRIKRNTCPLEGIHSQPLKRYGRNVMLRLNSGVTKRSRTTRYTER